MLRNNSESQSESAIPPLASLRKEALMTCDPSNDEDVNGEEKLDDAEVEALRNGVLHKWRQPTRCIGRSPFARSALLCKDGIRTGM